MLGSTIMLTVVSLFLAAYLPVSQGVTEVLFISHNGHLVDARLDPLVNPGTCSRHMHSVFGSASFKEVLHEDEFEDPDWQNDRRKDDQTTSNIIPNLSLYWAPSLYIYNPDDDLYYIAPSFSRTYYRIEHRKDISVINPIPPFLQLIAGTADRMTEWNRRDEHDDIRWTVRSNRRNTNSVEHGDWSYLRKDPDLYEDEDQLEMNIRFPNCLAVRRNGRPLISSPDFRSHATYSESNRCPDDFPYHIPTVNLEVRYNLQAMRDLLGRDVVDNIDNWILSTRDQSGASAHADFVSGWPEELMEEAIEHCRDGRDPRGRGRCPVENYFGQSSQEMRAKTIPLPGRVPDEDVSPVKRLPRGSCPALV